MDEHTTISNSNNSYTQTKARTTREAKAKANKLEVVQTSPSCRNSLNPVVSLTDTEHDQELSRAIQTYNRKVRSWK